MRMIPKIYALEMTQKEVNELEGAFFNLMSSFQGELGAEGLKLFEKKHPELYRLYKAISENRN